MDAAAGQGERGRGGGRLRRGMRSGGRRRGRQRGAILGGGCGLACGLWHRRAQQGLVARVAHYLAADIQHLRAGLDDLAGVVHARGRDVQACSAQLAGFAVAQLAGLGDQLAAGLDAACVVGRRAAVAEQRIALAAERAAVVHALGGDLQVGAAALGGDRTAVAQLAVGRQHQWPGGRGQLAGIAYAQPGLGADQCDLVRIHAAQLGDIQRELRFLIAVAGGA
ncbi:hypothetical protein D3C71_1540360 [compost metagenome]